MPLTLVCTPIRLISKQHNVQDNNNNNMFYSPLVLTAVIALLQPFMMASADSFVRHAQVVKKRDEGGNVDATIDFGKEKADNCQTVVYNFDFADALFNPGSGNALFYVDSIKNSTGE
jgi:hypothetical protein